MALLPVEQSTELIKKNKSILIIFKKDWTGDALSSALALASALKKIDKNIDVVCQDFEKKTNLSFLPLSKIKNKLKNLQKFVISISTAKTQIGEFYYDHDKEKLNIYITPQEGRFEQKDVSTSISNYSYDLIITVNSPDLESLGEAYEQNTEFFYDTPKINIDNSPHNEYFGNVDLVNLAKASTAEIVYELIGYLDHHKLIDEDVATQLLSGIISATKNFKTSNVTPTTLDTASTLISLGARREQIVQNLYQNRFLSTLRLWGRVLSRLNNDLDDKLVWSTISASDFIETSTAPNEIIDVIDELIVSMPKAEIIVLLYEIRKNGVNEIETIVYSVKNINSQDISKKFNPTGNKELAKFSLSDKNLAEAEKIVIEEIKNKLEN